MDETQLFADIRALLANLESEISSKKQEIASLEGSVVDAKSSATEANNEKLKAEKEFAVYTSVSEATKRVLNNELAKVRGEVDALIHQKTELKQENLVLDAENKKLKEYEKTAWVTLNAKDVELASREKAVQSRESLKPSSKPFLPPIQ